MTWGGLIAVMAFAAAGAASQSAHQQGAASGRTLVFFDWGKVTLSLDSRAELDDLAAEWRAAPPARVDVTGFSDRSGSSAVNLRASQRRAKTVAEYLISAGVPARLISTSARGEEQPLVATEDGVREVQNRRVEVVLTR